MPGSLLFFFENGKAARVELKAYQTSLQPQQAHRRLFGQGTPVPASAGWMRSASWRSTPSEPRCLIFHTALLAPKTTRTTQGVAVMTLKPKYHLETGSAFRRRRPSPTAAATGCGQIPAAGALVKEEDAEDRQMSLL